MSEKLSPIPTKSDLVLLVRANVDILGRVEQSQSEVKSALRETLAKVEGIGLHVVTLDGELSTTKEQINSRFNSVDDRLKRVESREASIDRGMWAVIVCTIANCLAWIGNHLKLPA
jgi:predicted nuclease with TOPRIM domain